MRVLGPVIHIPAFAPLVVVLVLACANGSAMAAIAGEGTTKEIQAVRAQIAPKIDGQLDDAVWSKAPVDDQFTQRFPIEGAPPSMKTEVQVAFDSDAFYVAISCFDPEPDKIVAGIARRDTNVPSDYVEFFLDAKHSHHSSYRFRVNAGGVLSDAEYTDDWLRKDVWDSVWQGKARITDDRWTVEVAIPLSVFRFSGQDVERFGFNVARKVHRTGEEVQWTVIPRNVRSVTSRLGHIGGLTGIRPLAAVEARPFGIVKAANKCDGVVANGNLKDSCSISADYGVDLKVSLTDNMIADIAVLPDFGQVDVDPVVLNLTNNEITFPENRPLFLEGLPVLRTQDTLVIWTRRVGERTSKLGVGAQISRRDGSYARIREAPAFVPILGALRVSGNIGPKVSVVGFNVVTAPETVVVEDEETGETSTLDIVPSKNYAALRGKYYYKGAAYVGFAATATTRFGESLVPLANHDTFTQIVDLRVLGDNNSYRLALNVAMTERLGGDTYALGDRNCSPGANCIPLTREDGTVHTPGSIGYAAAMRMRKFHGNLQWLFETKVKSDKFDINDLGFEPTWNLYFSQGALSYLAGRNFFWFKRAYVKLDWHPELMLDGTLQRLDINAPTSFLTNNFWRLTFTLGYQTPKRFTNRETGDGARYELPQTFSATALVGSDERKAYNGTVSSRVKKSSDGDLTSASIKATASLRPSSRFELALNANIGLTTGDLRVIDCVSPDTGQCWRASLVRDYTLAFQDSSFMSFTARGGFAFSTNLTLEGYAQLFAARGLLRDHQSLLGLTGEKPKLFRGRTTPLMGEPTGDSDFSFATLNSNIVLKWQATSGSSVLLVYTRAQRHVREQSQLGFSGLGQRASEQLVQLKYTRFITP